MQLQIDDPQEQSQQTPTATKDFSPVPTLQNGYLRSAFIHQNWSHWEFVRLPQPEVIQRPPFAGIFKQFVTWLQKSLLAYQKIHRRTCSFEN